MGDFEKPKIIELWRIKMLNTKNPGEVGSFKEQLEEEYITS